MHVRIAPYDAVILMLEPEPAATHALSSTGGEVLASGANTLTLRADRNGRYETALSTGAKVSTDVTGLAAAQPLNAWTLRAQTWTPGENQYTTVKTDQAPVTVTAAIDGKLPSWRRSSLRWTSASPPAWAPTRARSSSPATWQSTDGAYLSSVTCSTARG